MNLKNVKFQSIISINLFFLVFNNAGVDLSKPAIYSCQTGTTASTLAFIAYALGQKTLSVYNVRIKFKLKCTLNISASIFYDV
jgi:hypothetical protein